LVRVVLAALEAALRLLPTASCKIFPACIAGTRPRQQEHSAHLLNRDRRKSSEVLRPKTMIHIECSAVRVLRYTCCAFSAGPVQYVDRMRLHAILQVCSVFSCLVSFVAIFTRRTVDGSHTQVLRTQTEANKRRGTCLPLHQLPMKKRSRRERIAPYREVAQ